MTKTNWLLIAFFIAAGVATADTPEPNSDKVPIGRWDITVHGPEGDYPSWLEIRRSGNSTLVGSYVGRVGSARPISQVEFRAGRISFELPPQWEIAANQMRVSAAYADNKLDGVLKDFDGKELKWSALRAPGLKRAEPPVWGEPVELFNGNDLTGWHPRSAKTKNGWIVRDGLLKNVTPGNDLVTTAKFDDFQLHAEFRYPKGSNSGIYLRGRYEVQIEDDLGQEPDNLAIAGVYGFLSPSINATKPPGAWQSFDITLVGRVVTVIFNGERVIDRQTIPGITGGALDSHEGEPGPILLQGDHGPIEFRKVTLTPARQP
jgi:hypothetical protein